MPTINAEHFTALNVAGIVKQAELILSVCFDDLNMRPNEVGERAAKQFYEAMESGDSYHMCVWQLIQAQCIELQIRTEDPHMASDRCVNGGFE
jgi:hypothetical protein